MLSPLLESLALNLQGHAKIVAVDVVASPDLVQEHGVSAVPTILVFRDGILTHRMIGLGSLARGYLTIKRCFFCSEMGVGWVLGRVG